MKLNQPTSAVEISGAVSTPTGFNIAASKEAFKILSSGLYTNKIRAIIRELSCNAYDAHVAAGKVGEPFDLHLPTTFEPFFSVKDRGTGLEFIAQGCKTCAGIGKVLEMKETEQVQVNCKQCGGTGDYDAVRELYCTYFSSNKSDSNLFVGALGLGSKSPFCYTEGFSVTNIFQGMTRVYSCFLNEAGMPAVLLQTVEETPEVANGVEITFPVKQNDVWEFENQAKYVLEFFDPTPNINVPNLHIQRKDYTFRTAKWGMRKNEEDGKPRAIQGMVQYSIGEIDQSRLTYEQQQMAKLPLDLFFPIGQLSVAASRESLSNDEETIQNIVAALDGVKTGLMDDVRAKIAVAKTPWEARLIIYNLSNTKGIGHLVDRAFKAGDFNDVCSNFSLTAKDPKINQLDFSKVAIFEMKKQYSSGNQYAYKHRMTCELTPETDLSKPERFDITFTSKKSALFIVNDQGFGTDKYAHYLIQQDEEEDWDVVYLITRANKDVPWETVTQQGCQIIEALGQPPVQLMSALKARYKDFFTHAGVAQPARKILKYNGGTRGWYSNWNDASNSELPAVKYYLPIKSLEPQTGGFGSQGNGLSNFLSQVRGSKIFGIDKNTPIYGIPTWRLKDLDGTWVELFGYVMDKLVAYFTPENQAEYALHLSSSGYSNSIDSVLKVLAKKKPLPEDNLLQQFAEKFVRARETREAFDHLTNLVARAEARGLYKKPDKTIDFNELWKEILEMYPLLSHVSSRYSYNDEGLTVNIIQYVNLIDGERAAAELPGESFASLGVVQTENEETYAYQIN